MLMGKREEGRLRHKIESSRNTSFPQKKLNVLDMLFTESAHWADSVIELRCPSAGMHVCMSPPSEIYFRAFLPPLTKVLGFRRENLQ